MVNCYLLYPCNLYILLLSLTVSQFVFFSDSSNDRQYLELVEDCLIIHSRSVMINYHLTKILRELLCFYPCENLCAIQIFIQCTLICQYTIILLKVFLFYSIFSRSLICSSPVVISVTIAGHENTTEKFKHYHLVSRVAYRINILLYKVTCNMLKVKHLSYWSQCVACSDRLMQINNLNINQSQI